jgi:hypothetical protein
MGHAILLQLNASNWLIMSSLTDHFLNTRRKYITYEIFTANLHVMLFLCQPTHTHCKSSSLDSPKPALTRDSVCKQITATITHGKAGQGKTIRDKPAPQQLPKGKPKPLPKPRADRWASAATGLTLQTLSEPFPSRQSINNSSFDTSHTSAYSFNQYDK